jgi:hypothetical protein
MHLVNVVAFNSVVEHDVKIIEKINDFKRCALRRQLCELDDIREINRCRRKKLWRNLITHLKLVGHKSTNRIDSTATAKCALLHAEEVGY